MLSTAVPRAARRCRLTRLKQSTTSTTAQSWLASSTIKTVDSVSPRRHVHTPRRATTVLDEWVAREARPISLRQLMVYGRTLTESRLLNSANYVRTELPTRIAHRIRDMQQLPYGVASNSNINDVYNLYNEAFHTFRKIKEIKTLEDNDQFCSVIRKMLKTHLPVIPKLATGIIESSGQADRRVLDGFMYTILRARISRRVIAEQHLALTETFHSDWFSHGAKLSESEFIGEVFIKCVAKDVIDHCAIAVQKLARSTYGPDVQIPDIKVDGHLDANFPYILSHFEYIIGELLRNAVQAVIERQQRQAAEGLSVAPPPPIEVTICEAPKQVVIRISDQGGGIPTDELPYLWSFIGDPQSSRRLENLRRVPTLAATMQELHVSDELGRADLKTPTYGNSLASLTSRPPDLRLGIGLPLSKVYAEYWAGGLELHSLWGYGVDAFLQISKLGNKNEQLATRASVDSV